MNLPNRITLSRLGLSFALFVVLALMSEDVLPRIGAWGWIAWAMFFVATATDWLDGYIARRYQLVSPLGRILDPFVDKVVVCGTYVFLTALWPTYVPPWFTVIILGREFFVNALRGFMESRGVDFSAQRGGKIKMVFQCFSIGGILIMMGMRNENLILGNWACPWSGGLVSIVTSWLLWLALITTAYSGFQYATKGLRSLRELES